MMSLKARTIRGGLVKVSAQAAQSAVRLGSLMVLARLLEPEDFGVVGMVTAITGVLGLFKEFGLSVATVQRASITDDLVSTLFWINILVGAALVVVSIGLAPLVAAFYHEPRLLMVMIVLSSAFLVNAAGVQHTALLQRQMRFVALAAIEVVSLVVASTASFVSASRGDGYWALVVWTVSVPITSTLLAWIVSGWIPRGPRLDTGMLASMRFGGMVTLNGVVIHAAYNLDKILLGRYWGAPVVGSYGRAYQLGTLPPDAINTALGGVAFPVLSRLQNDPARLRSYFLKGYSLVLGLTIPITVACALFAGDLIPLVLGQKWDEAVPVYRRLAPAILVMAVINPTGWLLVSLGMVARSLKMALAIAPLVAAGCVFGLPYGPTGVAVGCSAAMTVWLVPHLLWCVRGTVVSFSDVALAIGRPLAGSIAAGAAASLALWAVDGSSWPALPRLLLGCSVFGVVYLWALLFVAGQKSFYLDVARTVIRREPEEVVESREEDNSDVAERGARVRAARAPGW